MRYIKLYEGFTDHINEESLKQISYVEFDELIESSSIEEVTDKDLDFCVSQVLEVFKDTDFKFLYKTRCVDFPNNIKSCVTFTEKKDDLSYHPGSAYYIVFYKFSDDYWIIETYLGYWIADYYEGIKEWTKVMKSHFSLYYNNIRRNK